VGCGYGFSVGGGGAYTMARTLLGVSVDCIGWRRVREDVRPHLGAFFGDDGEAQLVVFEAHPGYFPEGG